jgi:hypothetical protein
VKIAETLLSLVGLLLLLLAGLYGAEALRFMSQTETAMGHVVEHKPTAGLNSSYRDVDSYARETIAMYAPIVEFTTASGESIRFQASWSEGDPPAIGTDLQVRYRPEQPADARVAGLSSLFGSTAIVLILALAFGGAGIMMLRR